MRLWFAILAFVATTDGACASSFVTIAPPAKGQASSFIVLGDWNPEAQAAIARDALKVEDSIAHLGEPEGAFPTVLLAYPLPSGGNAAAAEIEIISPSIIAFDPPAPAVTFEKVAAIAPQPQAAKIARDAPIVIRGGIVGAGSAVAEPVALPTALKTASKSDGKTGKVETRTNAAGQKIVVIKDEANGGKKEPDAPASPDAPAAAPPRERPQLR